MQNFNDLPWHDASLQKIYIDRGDPGNNDSIVLEVVWPGERLERSRIVFKDVYWADLNLNFGIVGQESILVASQGDATDEDVVAVKDKWRKMLQNIELFPFTIEMNTTASVIKIIARSFEIAIL